MGEIIYLTRERIHVTLYTQTGPLGCHRTAFKEEDQQALAILKAVITELGPWYFDLRTRCWMTHFYEAAVHGGWWSPVVMVDHAVFSQGRVPDHAALRAHLSRQIHILQPRLAKSS
ncbi:MAG TPA: hypothetical protein VNL71_12375 [Chloroflexota bacterium]|nr:hypothetical protein [Chloroflexota bacterium]